MQGLIEDAQNNTIEPMLFKLSLNRGIPTHENTLPIHRETYDIAKMEVYELHRKIEELSPECELVGVKTSFILR